MKPTVWITSAAVLFALPAAATIDPLSGLDFLVGTWRGSTAGTSGTDVFERDLDGHILQRRSQSVAAAADGKAQSSMKATLIVFPAGAGDVLAAIYFDTESHVIHYNHVNIRPGERVEFVSDGDALGAGFRLTYSLKARGVLHVRFEMAPSGQATYRLISEADETATY